MGIMVIRVVEFSSRGYKIGKKNCLRVNMPKGKSLNFENWCSGELSKIGHHFRNKMVLKLMISKKVKNKKCAAKLVFFNNKKNEKDSDDFLNRKLTSKVKFWRFLTPPYYTNSQNLLISLGYVDS